MTPGDFLKELIKLGWVVNQQKKEPLAEEDFKQLAAGRFINAPDELKQFVNLFLLCANKEDTTWFLSSEDYLEKTDAAFVWNEFEVQSLEVAEQNEIQKIEDFWQAHLPFMISVKNGYAYFAVILSGANKGSVVIGNEPAYEDVSIVAADMQAFFNVFISFLETGTAPASMNILR